MSKPNVTKALGIDILKETSSIVQKMLTLCQVEGSIREKIKKAFSKVNSVYKFESQMSKRNDYIKPRQITVFDTVGTVLEHGAPVLDNVKEKAVLMPIKHNIQRFFQLPDVLSDVVENMKKLEQDSGQLSHFLQGSLWKNIRAEFSTEDIVMPVVIYADDFEPDNALGGNAGTNKQMGVYFSIPVFPQHLLASPDYVFEALLFPSRIKAIKGGLNQALVDLVNVFVSLETEGIVVGDEESGKKVFFVVSLVIGDNLALNELLGFSKSFNSDYYCRFCTASKVETKKDVYIREEKLRTPDTFQQHVDQNEPKKTGVYFNPIFHRLKYFHAAKNYYADIFHDVYEGIARYEITEILNYYIYQKKICNLKTFNQLMTEFNYGEIEMSTVPKEITDTQIKKKNLRMTGAQMKTLLHFIPLMFGHLVAPTDEDYQYWIFLTDLVEITDMLLESTVSNDYLQKLDILLKKHLKQYLELFGPLKPKHHFLMHYKMIMSQVGPLRNLMCFVFEQKNRHLKLYANAMNQRINLSWSLMSKAAYRFENFIEYNLKNGFPSNFSHQKFHSISYEELQQMENGNLLLEEYQINENDVIKEVHSLRYKNKTYKKKYFILLKNCDKKNLFEIKNIICINDNYFIIVQSWTVLLYSEHFKSYEVGTKTAVFKIITFEDIFNIPFLLHRTINENMYYRIKNV